MPAFTSSPSGQQIPIHFKQLFLNPQKPENIEKLINEHLLSDLITQRISKHSDVNMTLEMDRKTFLKVGKNTVDVLTWYLLSLVQKAKYNVAEVHLTETFKLSNAFATIKNIAQCLSNSLPSNKLGLTVFHSVS